MRKKLFVLAIVLLVLASLNCSMVAYAKNTTSVYVITKTEEVSDPASSNEWKSKEYYFYTNNGLLKDISDSKKYTESSEPQFTYDASGNLLEAYGGQLTYSYDKKGKVKKYTSSLPQIIGEYRKTFFSGKPKYNANGLVKSIPHNKSGDKVIFKYNENGLPVEETTIQERYNNRRISYHYQYDAMGNVVETNHTIDGVPDGGQKYKYTYENGRVSKRNYDSDPTQFSPTKYYSYKQITIPKKLKAKVQKQQWKIINFGASTSEFSLDRPW